MKQFRQELSRLAEADLKNIASYTLEHWGELQLVKYRAVLEEGFAELRRDPPSPRTKDRPELFSGCRSLHVGRHLILYRVKGDVVQIARVLHDQLELERHIPSVLFDSHDP